jgi:tRNA modification GTPase
LLDRDRAIVSHIPGTTRDIVEDHLRLNGLNLRLIDTAGIRAEAEEIEQEGIRRTREAMKSADLILLVLDVTRGIGNAEQQLLEEVPSAKTIVIWNKSDLTHEALPPIALPHVITISAKEKRGLEGLHKKIDEVIWDKGPPSREEVLITNVRHKESLARAIVCCNSVIEGLKTEVSPEFLSIDMRQCLHELGKIIGMDVTEDILSAIFSKFCIGK